MDGELLRAVVVDELPVREGAVGVGLVEEGDVGLREGAGRRDPVVGDRAALAGVSPADVDPGREVPMRMTCGKLDLQITYNVSPSMLNSCVLAMSVVPLIEKRTAPGPAIPWMACGPVAPVAPIAPVVPSRPRGPVGRVRSNVIAGCPRVQRFPAATRDSGPPCLGTQPWSLPPNPISELPAAQALPPRARNSARVVATFA